MSIAKETEKKMAHALDHFQTELQNIRTGRANPAVLDSVTVEAYGTQMRLKEMATVTVPEPRQLLITPFDANNVGPIAKGIEKANLGFNPIKDGNTVRIQIPAMDEAMRKEMVKVCHDKKEHCKVSIRNARREGNDTVKEQKNSNEITEDVQKSLEKEIQELTDKFCSKADVLAQEKEKEVTTI